jgi:hypothetical protein
MFCPKCSQQQISDETIFCSRCGFQLSVVKALLVNDDMQPGQNAEIAIPDRSLRKRDVTIGALLMFVFALAVAVVTVDMPSSHSARIIFLVIAWFALSLLINIKPIIGYFFHGDASTPTYNPSPSKIMSGQISQFENKMQNPALDAAHSVTAADLVMPRRITAEIVQPPSITEETTNLLRNN